MAKGSLSEHERILNLEEQVSETSSQLSSIADTVGQLSNALSSGLASIGRPGILFDPTIFFPPLGTGAGAKTSSNVVGQGSVNSSCKDGLATITITTRGPFSLSITVTDADLCGGVTVKGIPDEKKDRKIGSGNSETITFFVCKTPTTITIKCNGENKTSNGCRFSYTLYKG